MRAASRGSGVVAPTRYFSFGISRRDPPRCERFFVSETEKSCHLADLCLGRVLADSVLRLISKAALMTLGRFHGAPASRLNRSRVRSHEKGLEALYSFGGGVLGRRGMRTD